MVSTLDFESSDPSSNLGGPAITLLPTHCTYMLFHVFSRPAWARGSSRNQSLRKVSLLKTFSWLVLLSVSFWLGGRNLMKRYFHTAIDTCGFSKIFKWSGLMTLIAQKETLKAAARFELTISCLLDRRFNQLSHAALPWCCKNKMDSRDLPIHLWVDQF